MCISSWAGTKGDRLFRRISLNLPVDKRLSRQVRRHIVSRSQALRHLELHGVISQFTPAMT